MERGVPPSLCTLEDAFILTEDFGSPGYKSASTELDKAEALVKGGLMVQKWVQKNHPDGTKVRTFPDGKRIRIEKDGTETPL